MFFLWLFLGLFAVIILINVLIITSTAKLKIENFCFTLPKSEFTNTNFKVILELYLFGIIKILGINIDKTKLKRQTLKDEFSKVGKKLRKDQNGFDFEFFNVIKYLIKNMSLEMLDLNIYLGTEDASLTAISVGTISGVIGLGLGYVENNKKQQRRIWNYLKKRKRLKTEKGKSKNFKVIPIYQGRNLLKIDFNGIFAIKVRDIINIIYNLLKKGRVEKNGRTSNRRSYAYSNE